jgi:glycosyltransferase involved in cell wall biosynthesis
VTDKTSLSIITVCLNSARTLGDTLASVNAQTHPDIEHIVIDGGSTDGTQDLARAQGRRVAQLVSEPDRGIYDAMNKGLALATGDVVGFLNADDAFASPAAAAAIARAFDRETLACYGDVVYVSAEDPTRVIRYWRSGPYRRGLCAQGWAPPHPTLYVRREAVLRHGGFDERLRVAADFEMALRLLDVAGLPVRYIPEVLVRMRAGGVSNGSLKGILRGHRDMAAALRAHGLPAGWGWSARRLARRIPQLLSRPR